MTYLPTSPARCQMRLSGSSLFAGEYKPPVYYFTKDAASNPEGIESLSPGLRGTSYPGGEFRDFATLKGLNPFRNDVISNPFRVGAFNALTQGSPSGNRSNPGLKDSIPLGLVQPARPRAIPVF